MTPEEVGRSYDSIAERWSDASFPRTNGIELHLPDRSVKRQLPNSRRSR